MRRHALRILRACAFACACACACARTPPTETTTAPPPDAGKIVKPVDHLAPGELAEGTEKVFGLVLPKLMPLDRKFDDVAFASGPVLPGTVTKYIEARVRDGTVKRVGETEVFDKVRLPGEQKLLRVTVERPTNGGGTRLEIRDVTPLPAVNVPPDEESRWRAVGMKPNGEPLDRTKLK